MMSIIFLFSPDATEQVCPPVHPDKVAVASIPESILTTSQQEREAAAAGRKRTARRSSSATVTHTNTHTHL